MRDNAKVTVAKIQELTVDLLAIDQKSVMEEPESVSTQEGDLEQKVQHTIFSPKILSIL